MKRRKRKVGKGFKIFAFLLILTTIILLGKIIYINILSDTLLTILIGAILLIDGICLLLLLRSKHKKIGLLLSSILMIIFSLITYYMDKTTTVFESLNINYKTYNYSIVVLKNSNYKSLNDLKNKKIGYYDEESEETTKSLNKINNKVKLKTIATDDIHNLRDNLINNEVDAIIIEQSYLEILNENILSDNTTFKEKIKEIYDFTIKIKIDDISKDLNVTKKPFNIYISGIDTYGEITSVSRSDVNMVATINPSTNQVLLTSLPRDYYVKLSGKTGYKDKITHAGLYGVETSIKTIEDLLNIEINYYIKVNFTSVIDIVDTIEGVNVYSEYEFTSIDNMHYEQGYNFLNGLEALSFARERKAFAIGDRQRVKNGQALLNAIIEKCLSPSIIKKYNKLLDAAQNSFVTNMKMSRITSLVKMQLTNNYSWNIISNSLNGIDDNNYTYSAPNTKVYVMSPVEESVDYAIELIKQVENNEILDKAVVEEKQKEIIRIVNAESVKAATEAKVESNKKDEEDTEMKNEQEEAELTAKLVKSNVEFTEGDEFIYHGIIATYNNKDVTKDSSLKLKFRVQDEEFDDYRDLIYFVSNLDKGDYIINYIVSYKEKNLTLNQSVTIKEVFNKKEQLEENENSNQEENDNETEEAESDTDTSKGEVTDNNDEIE